MRPAGFTLVEVMVAALLAVLAIGSAISSGTSPRNRSPISAHAFRAPPCPKISLRPAQCGHRK